MGSGRTRFMRGYRKGNESFEWAGKQAREKSRGGWAYSNSWPKIHLRGWKRRGGKMSVSFPGFANLVSRSFPHSTEKSALRFPFVSASLPLVSRFAPIGGKRETRSASSDDNAI